jgi:hypothetical protein
MKTTQERIEEFLGGLPADKLERFAEALAKVEENVKYAELSEITGQTVEQIKSAELINDLVMEGFYSGLDDIMDSGGISSMIGRKK